MYNSDGRYFDFSKSVRYKCNIEVIIISIMSFVT